MNRSIILNFPHPISIMDDKKTFRAKMIIEEFKEK